jgi:hypothetical protein
MSEMLSCTQFHFCRESRRDASRGSIPVMAVRLSNHRETKNPVLADS